MLKKKTQEIENEIQEIKGNFKKHHEKNHRRVKKPDKHILTLFASINFYPGLALLHAAKLTRW